MNKLGLLLVLLCLVGCSSSDKPKLHLYIWSDAIKPDVLRTFEEQEGCRIVIDTYDSNEALYAKLRLGASGYDLIFPSNYLLEIMAQKGMIHPLAVQKLPNLKNNDSNYPPLTIGETIYGIPYLVSYAGIAYRKDRIQNPPTSWKIFRDSKYRGRMTLLNDVRETLGASLISLNTSINSTDKNAIMKAADQLILWKSNIAKFESEQYKNGIASGEYLIVHGYGGDILQVVQENPMVAFTYPEEGTAYSIDYAAILKDAPQPNLAHAFINFLLEPEIAKENTLYTYYLHPCKPAYALLPEELQHNELLFPPEDVLQKAQLIKNVGPALPFYTQAWDHVKEG